MIREPWSVHRDLDFSTPPRTVKLRKMQPLRYRAGPRALEHLRRFGLREQIRSFVAPATGPKWLVAYGFDQALIQSRLLEAEVPTLLAGASAGAWRSLSLASPDAERTHRALVSAYCEEEFSRADTPETVGRAFENLLAKLFGGREAAILEHAKLRLAIHTARARGSHADSGRFWHLGALALAALVNPLGSRAQTRALERVTFHSPGVAERLQRHAGRRVELSPRNLLRAALASATVPMAMAPVREIPGAPAGVYLDGGMTDYHMAEPYLHPSPGMTLLFTHQPRILARWLDQHLPWRQLERSALDDVLHVFPSEEFVRSLPGGRVPTREDYAQMIDDSAGRVARWKRVASESERIGETFLADVESARLLDLVEPLA